MDMKKLIERINFLYKKSKEEGLTEEEKNRTTKIKKRIYKYNKRKCEGSIRRGRKDTNS
jgi:uncharacterized protein YnzC (UPF0291/DUF896 family)